MNLPKSVMAIWHRLTVWADIAARFWARYWLLLIGSFLVLGSVILKWVQSPFSHDISGLKLSFLHDLGVTPHFSLFSVGVMGVIVLGVGILFLKKLPFLLGLAAAVLLMLWAITPAQIAFREPSMLRRLTYELQVLPLQKVFSKDYLSQNYGAPELVPKRLVLYSAWGRLVAAWSFLRLGWYCFGLGGLLIGAYAIAQMTSGRFTRLLTLLCLPVGAFIIILIPPAIGQHYFTDGALAATHGRNQEAVAGYREAIRWDSWHAYDIDLYAAIGSLQKQSGLSPASAERRIARAVDLQSKNQFEAAIFELSQAEEAGGALAETAHREVALTRMSLGLALYRAGGVNSAVTHWELALAEDPSLIYVLPYLARGYYDLGRYQAGVEAALKLAKLIKDHQYALANAYSTAADCYAKLGNDAESRRYYTLSLAADPILNYWALTGLAGE
ncbi:MAG: tetratricopeptide repeat protein [Chthoniobacterales bacterium]